MIEYSVYRIETGEIVASHSGSAANMLANTPEGCSAILGHFPRGCRIVDGVPVFAVRPGESRGRVPPVRATERRI